MLHIEPDKMSVSVTHSQVRCMSMLHIEPGKMSVSELMEPGKLSVTMTYGAMCLSV